MRVHINNLKEGDNVIYMNSWYEVILNEFTDKLALDNPSGQVFLDDIPPEEKNNIHKCDSANNDCGPNCKEHWCQF